MRKLAKVILALLVAYVGFSGFVIWLLPMLCPALRRLDIVKVSIQFLGVIATLAAVLWALFGASVQAMFRRSCLDLHFKKAPEYCYLAKETSEVAGETRTRLGVFARVSNASPVDAESCQVVTDEIFASSDGIKFSLIQKVCTTGFTWVYEGTREAIIRKGVDKHFKAVELLEKVIAPLLSPDGKVIRQAGRVISLSVCIPNFVGGQDSFEVGPDYKGVMIPIRLVSKTEDVKTYYLKVVWLGSELKDFMTADKLKVMRLSESEAKSDIV